MSAPLSFLARLAGREQGQALAVIVLGMGTLLGLVALSIDVGNLLVTRQREQQAADAAVLAGIAVMNAGGTADAAKLEARQYAGSNGFSSGVTVNVPPTQGAHAGDPTAIEVVISRSVNPIFASFVGLGPWDVNARAVSRLVGEPVGFGVITLHPTQCESLTVGSSSQLHVTNGGIYVNSSCTTDKGAMETGSSSSLIGDVISIGGTYTKNGSSTFSPTPKIRQAPVPDPWASLTPPAASGLVDRTPGNCRIRNTTTFQPGLYRCAPLLIDDATVTFNPGTYVFRGGLAINGSKTTTFQRGLYIIEGGGFDMASNTVATNADGMLIYNSCNGACTGSNWFHMSSSARLTAKPYGAPYGNLLIWQDKNNTAQLNFDSGSLVSVTGQGAGIYAKNATIAYGCSSVVALQFVASNVAIGSNARIIVDVAGFMPVYLQTFRLVE